MWVGPGPSQAQPKTRPCSKQNLPLIINKVKLQLNNGRKKLQRAAVK